MKQAGAELVHLWQAGTKHQVRRVQIPQECLVWYVYFQGFRSRAEPAAKAAARYYEIDGSSWESNLNC